MKGMTVEKMSDRHPKAKCRRKVDVSVAHSCSLCAKAQLRDSSSSVMIYRTSEKGPVIHFSFRLCGAQLLDHSPLCITTTTST